MGGPTAGSFFHLIRPVGSEIARRRDITATTICNDKNIAAIFDLDLSCAPPPLR